MPNIITEDYIQFTPKDMSPHLKVEIDGTDVTDDLTPDLEYTGAVTDEIGSCIIKLINNDEAYNGLYTGGESISIYLDETDATTKVFEGAVEKTEKESGDYGMVLKITGRHVSSNLLDKTVNETYTDETCDTILKDIISTYASGFTSTNVAATTMTHSTNWNGKPFWDCVIELCSKAGFDCRVDDSKDFHFFEKNSQLNATEAFFPDNIFADGIGGMGTDVNEVKNRIIVYGQTEDGGQIIYTTPDSDATESQTEYGVKELIIEDSKITTYDQAQSIGDAKLEILKSLPTFGSVRGFMLFTLNAGEKLWISYPEYQIHDKFRIVKFTTKPFFGETTVYVEKVKTIPSLFKDRISKETDLETIRNPYNMAHSMNFSFADNSEIELFSSTEVSDGKLVPSSSSSGSATSVTRVAPQNITQCHLKHNGSSLVGNVTYYVSNNNGSSWEDITPNTMHTFTSTGSQLKLKIVIMSSSVEIDWIDLLYKYG
jgi:hypothetical protein